MQSLTDAHRPSLLYKGKVTGRSWPQLPEEIIRLIATHFLWDLALTSYCPKTWEARRLWPSRMLYATLRDAHELEKQVMSISPEWHRAISKHLFWKQAINLIDCNDTLIHHMVIHPKPQMNASSNAISQPIYLTPFTHMKNMLGCSCLVCRINYPYSNVGLAAAKKMMVGTLLGPVPVCKDHDRRRAFICGLCLRDTVIAQSQDPTVRGHDMTGIVENEDEDMWPGVEATCKSCREEWLLRRASHPRDREAIGGLSLQSDDWETRQCVDNFVEIGDGVIGDVLTVAREKLWLKRFTKYESLGQHALAAQKTTRDEEEEEEEADDSEEDRELLLMRDANQVRDMSLHDWARKRILDGHWISPADAWYHYQVPGQPAVVPAIHPCPWTIEVDGEPPTDEEQAHPTQAIVACEIPPTFALCEHAYGAYMKEMRAVLLHPLRNIVRKIIMECAIPTAKGYEDPAQKASRMSLEDVVTMLREEELIWYDGVDWIERKRNEEETSRRRVREEADAMRLSHDNMKHDHRKEDDSDSTTSSSSSSGRSAKFSMHGSGSSNATSPVLSTTTLQTTPSPPPLSDDAAKDDEPLQQRQQSQQSRPRIIPVDPVRATPLMLSSIPHVPVTVAHLPQYSMDALKSVWRDACAPLYHCRCSICERAKVADSAARAAYAALSSPVVPSQQLVQPQQPLRTTIYPQNAVRVAKPVNASEIELKEVGEIELDGDGEEEVDYDASDMEYDDEFDEEDPLDDDDYRYSVSPEAEVVHANAHQQEVSQTRSKKRSSDELEDVEEISTADGSVVSSESPASLYRPDRHHLGGTPPKRARVCRQALLSVSDEDDDAVSLEDHADYTATAAHGRSQSHPSPVRSRKRGSEELEGDDAHGVRSTDVLSKRVKVDTSSSRTSIRDMPLVVSPTSTNGEEVDYSPFAGNAPTQVGQRGWIRKEDMDGLIRLDDEDD